MKKTELKIEMLPISEISGYERNARKHGDVDVEAIAESIKQFGFSDPIGIWGEDNTIVEGHGRLAAAKKLKLKEVPTIRLDHLSDEERKAYGLAHNRTAELSMWDLQALNDELVEIGDEIDMSKFGFDGLTQALEADEEAEREEEQKTEQDDYDEEAESRCKVGDIWQLGNHRLMCGDCTDAENIKKLMNGEKAVMVLTDPPYGVGKESEGVANDNLYREKLVAFNRSWFDLSVDALGEVGSWYCFGVFVGLSDFYQEIIKNKKAFCLKNFITWFKGHGAGQGAMWDGMRSYRIRTEFCLFCMKGKQEGLGFDSAEFFYEGFEPIRLFYKDLKERCKWTAKDTERILGNQTFGHYISKSQWQLPTEEAHNKLMRAAAETLGDEIRKEYDEVRKEYDEIRKEYLKGRTYFNNTWKPLSDVWQVDYLNGASKERAEAGGHATPKPLALLEIPIRTSSQEGDLVVDFFGGSGSTLIACEQLNRRCFMIELLPKWCDVILARWEKLTGQKAVRVNE